MAEPLRILHVVGSLGIGGIQTYLMELYRHINKSIVQFDFVVHIKTGESYVDEIKTYGGRVFYIANDAFEKKNWREYFRFWESFFDQHQEYKVIHGHLRSTSAIYLWKAKKAGCYTIAHSHATSNGYGIAGIIKDVLQYPTRFIADCCMGCSQQANEWMFGRRANSNTCFIVHNGIDSEKFAFKPETRIKMREELNIYDETLVIGTVGRLVKQKNHDLLIRAFAQAKKTNTEIKLLIVGDGPLFKQYQHLINSLSLQDSIDLLGSRTNINELLQAFDCFVMPSRNEGLGIAVIEAQAADLPVIISDAISKEACITNSVIRIQSFDKNEWERALLNVKRKIRTDNSKLIIKAGYDIKTAANWLSNFYFNLLSSGDNK